MQPTVQTFSEKNTQNAPYGSINHFTWEKVKFHQGNFTIIISLTYNHKL